MSEKYLICPPVEGTPLGKVVLGSSQRRCCRCDARVWVTRASSDHAGTDAAFLCLPCALADAERLIRAGEVMPPSAEQVAEINAHLQRQRKAGEN